jgi:hypothetical protein
MLAVDGARLGVAVALLAQTATRVATVISLYYDNASLDLNTAPTATVAL